MAKALDQFKEVQGSMFVPTMLTSLTMTMTYVDYVEQWYVCIMMYNTIIFYMVIYMIIQFVYKPYVYKI